MMKSARSRVLSSAGESLVESLAALLICSMAIALLMGAVVTAAKINSTAITAQETLERAQSAAESYTSTKSSTRAVSVTTQDGETSLGTYTVIYYGEDQSGLADSLVAYKYGGASAPSYLAGAQALVASNPTTYASTDAGTKALSAAYARAYGGEFPKLTSAELALSTAAVPSTYWKPIHASNGALILCATTTTASVSTGTSAAQNTVLIYYDGTYYAYLNPLHGDKSMWIGNGSFDVSILGNPTRTDVYGQWWKAVS